MLVPQETNVLAKRVLAGEMSVNTLHPNALREIIIAGEQILEMGSQRWVQYLGTNIKILMTKTFMVKGAILKANPEVGISIFSAYDLNELLVCSDIRHAKDLNANIWRVVMDGEFEDGFVDLTKCFQKDSLTCAFNNPLTMSVVDRPSREPASR
ncbi:MAG: hypothetical protein KAS32_30340 [Candidatus Peribacteraceae bacterium]|nr:hypothetical protein [Candidatus Peribacteraceae bacterium]